MTAMNQGDSSLSRERGAKWAILMLAAQAADESAYRVLLKDLSSYLEGYLGRSLRDKSYINDIIQESLLGVHKARHTYDTTRAFLPWLHAIVRYKSIDYLRQQNRRKEVEILSSDSLENYSETYWVPQTNTELDEELQRALLTLPAKQKRIVELLKLEGFTAKEVGLQLGLSEGAVKVSAHRAYTAMRQRLLGEKK